MYQGDSVTLIGLGWGEWVCGDPGRKGKICQAERDSYFWANGNRTVGYSPRKKEEWLLETTSF